MAFFVKGDPNDSLGAQLGRGLGTGLGTGLQQGIQKRQQMQQGLALANLLGLEDEEISQFGRLSPEQQKGYLEVFKQQQKQTPKESKQAYNKGLNIIGEQRKLLKSGHLGPVVGLGKRDISSTFTKEGRKSRAKYEQLGKSLISMASNIPIRNREEFKTLADKLFDPTMDQAKIEGVLDAMQTILEEGLAESGMERRETGNKSKEKALSKESAMKFLKAAKGDKEAARQMAKEAGFNF